MISEEILKTIEEGGARGKELVEEIERVWLNEDTKIWWGEMWEVEWVFT